MAITKIQSESLNLADDYSFTGTITGAGGDNNPSFFAVSTSSEDGTAVSNDTLTKMTFSTEVFDTDNCYDNSTNYRFTPNVAGKYYFNWVAQENYTSSAASAIQIYIRKNGSDIAEAIDNTKGSEYGTLSVSTTVIMNGSSDYVEFWLYFTGGSGVVWRPDRDRQFAEGYKLIE